MIASAAITGRYRFVDMVIINNGSNSIMVVVVTINNRRGARIGFWYGLPNSWRIEDWDKLSPHVGLEPVPLPSPDQDLCWPASARRAAGRLPFTPRR